MSQIKAPPRLSRKSPWWVLIGGGLAGAVAPGPIVLSTLSVFIIPITLETGFDATTVTAGYACGALGMAIGIIYVGRLLDKIAVKYILIPSFVLFGISTACIALTPPVAPLFLLPYFFGGLFGSGTAIPFTKVVVGWFDNKRAIALGIMAGLTALGSSATPLIANSLINNVGWRAAYALLGLLCVTVSVTLILTFVRARAERHVRGKLVTETVEHGRAISLDLPGKTLREALHSRSFWIIAIGLGLVGGVVVGLQVNLVPMMVQRGLTVSQSAILLSVFGIAGMVGRILGGFIIDKVHATIIGPIVIILPVLGILLLHPPFASALLAASLMGFAFGVEFDLMALLVSRYLGLKAFGKIIGLMGAIFLVGTGSGPVLVSVGAKLTGNYDAVMPVLMGILIVAAVSIMFLGKYPYPAIKDFDKVAAQDELAAAELLSNLAETETHNQK